MFGLGMPEILLILAIALIVIGPQKLPDLAKTLGRAMGEFKRSAQDFKKSLEVETTIKDIKTPAADLKSVIKEVNQKKADPPPDETFDRTKAESDASPSDTPLSSGSGDSETPPEKPSNAHE